MHFINIKHLLLVLSQKVEQIFDTFYARAYNLCALHITLLSIYLPFFFLNRKLGRFSIILTIGVKKQKPSYLINTCMEGHLNLHLQSL